MGVTGRNINLPSPSPLKNWGQLYVNKRMFLLIQLVCQPNDHSDFFLVACYTTLHPAMSVGRLVGLSPFYFFGVFELFEHTAPAQMLL